MKKHMCDYTIYINFLYSLPGWVALLYLSRFNRDLDKLKNG